MSEEKQAKRSGEAPGETTAAGGRLGRRRLLQTVALVAVGGAAEGATPARRSDREPAPGARDALQRAVAYLERAQLPNGSWQQYPGITALGVMAVAAGGGVKHPAVERGAKFLAGMAKPSGAIYDDRNPARALPNYNTALSMTALKVAADPAHQEIIRRAQAYLSGTQFDEAKGVARSQPAYGGVGYGSQPDRPDLSNLQHALEALKVTDFPSSAPFWEKAIVFLQRCQNRRESNDQAWAGTDGGFIYAPSGESKAGEHHSYASMTYAGLKSYLYCGVSRTDPRVQAAWSWIRAHFNLAENPGMGEAGLYYNYHTLSKTLFVMGQRTVTDLAGGRHNWTAELAAELVRRQGKDGSWVNRNPRWMEDNPQLVTSYALIALARCVHGAAV
jgi:squalene-hopene/tetraprenyl-beta-curcumene cyclase